MQEKDKKQLLLFVERMGMYIIGINKGTITAFIHGYETGRQNQCKFTQQLSSIVAQKHHIERTANGWIGQIERLTEKLNSDWVTVFKQESIKILISH